MAAASHFEVDRESISVHSSAAESGGVDRGDSADSDRDCSRRADSGFESDSIWSELAERLAFADGVDLDDLDLADGFVDFEDFVDFADFVALVDFDDSAGLRDGSGDSDSFFFWIRALRRRGPVIGDLERRLLRFGSFDGFDGFPSHSISGRLSSSHSISESSGVLEQTEDRDDSAREPLWC